MVNSSFCFFFFSSRRRHTRWNCDWSSDVCSSDLQRLLDSPKTLQESIASQRKHDEDLEKDPDDVSGAPNPGAIAEAEARRKRLLRSEERRVGKECRSRGRRERAKKQ